MLTSLSPRARAVIARLGSMDLEHPLVDRPAAERALRRYLAASRRPIRPVRWSADAAHGFTLAASLRLPKPPFSPATVEEDLAFVRGVAGIDELLIPWPVPNLRRDPAWRPAPTQDTLDAGAALAHVSAREKALLAAKPGGMRWIAERVQIDLRRRRVLTVGQLPPERLGVGQPGIVEIVAEHAVESAASIAAVDASEARSPELAHTLQRSLALIDACEAGLWMFIVGLDEIVAVPRPGLRLLDDRPHCADGPAVWWPGGARYYFWRGVIVPEEVIVNPDALTGRGIMKERNAEVRRAIIERIGFERFMTLIGDPRPHHVDHTGTLYRIPLAGDPEPLVVVRVVDPSTSRRYFLRVPPRTLTAREAVAWSFGMKGSEWNPVAEA